MTLNLLLFLISIPIIIKSNDIFTEVTSKMTKMLEISDFIIDITVVTLKTSLPLTQILFLLLLSILLIIFKRSGYMIDRREKTIFCVNIHYFCYYKHILRMIKKKRKKKKKKKKNKKKLVELSYQIFPRIRKSVIVFSFLILVLVFILISLNIFGTAFRKLGFPPEYSVYFLFLSLICSYINIPIKKVRSHVPVISDNASDVLRSGLSASSLKMYSTIAINLGGAVIPIDNVIILVHNGKTG